MLTLEGSGLRVSVLDPSDDEARLGPRYVAGGYVWQVTDERHGALCSGPEFPALDPPPFDGQGLPEVFELALGAGRARVGDDVYVLGVGRVRRESAVRPFHVRDNPSVSRRAPWAFSSTPSGLLAESRDAFEDDAFELTRELELAGRVLVSSTRVRNRGARELPVRWFAHPFFPWAGDEVCRFSLESALAETAPLRENERGFWERRAGVEWSAGHYVLPRVPLGAPLAIEQRHPALGNVRVECRFPLGGLALWGNARTFSCEPFFQTLVLPGAEARWAIAYDFGTETRPDA